MQCVQCMITRLECPASTSANRLETSAIVVMFMRMIATGVAIILSMGSCIKKTCSPYLKIKQGCRGKLAGSEEHQKAEEEAEKAPGRGKRGHLLGHLVGEIEPTDKHFHH